MREKLLAIAASLLGLNATDGLDLVDGRVLRLLGGTWTPTELTLPQIARTAHLDPLKLPAGMEPGLHVTVAYDPPPMTYANATHVAIVEVDIETGRIAIARHLVAHDAGTMINPLVVEGQVHGAVAMGLSGSLLEHCRYDDAGQNLAGSLMDYAIAKAGDLPAIEVVPCDHPNRLTPAGIKGMSEGGVMGAIGALANAVSDALAPLGAVVEALPLTPERVHALVSAARPRR
jgi:carbon-monoxide dehydrogenase large subunit